MAAKPEDDRRATTLKISLTQELAEAVAFRVRSGFYTSASELVREALRALFRLERTEQVATSKVNEESMPHAAARFAAAMELLDVGVMAQTARLRQEAPDLSAEEVQARLDALAEEQETGPGLRAAPERLEKLLRKRRGQP